MKGEVACATQATTEDADGRPERRPEPRPRTTTARPTSARRSPRRRAARLALRRVQAEVHAALPGAQGRHHPLVHQRRVDTTRSTASRRRSPPRRTRHEQERSRRSSPPRRRAGEDLFEATNWAVEEWDLAMKTAIQTARLVECKRTGGANCATTFPMWTGQQDDNEEAVAISRDLDICRRAPGRAWARPERPRRQHVARTPRARRAGRADLRHAGAGGRGGPRGRAQVDPRRPERRRDGRDRPDGSGDRALPQPGRAERSPGVRPARPLAAPRRHPLQHRAQHRQAAAALGVGHHGGRATTRSPGEKVAASINIWTHVTDIASQSLVDLVRYMNGELTTARHHERHVHRQLGAGRPARRRRHAARR